MRTLASEVVSGLHALNQRGAWAYLLEITVDSSSKEYLTTHPTAITYQNITYSPFPIVIGEKNETVKPEMKVFQITVANIDRRIASYLENGKLLGNNVKIMRIFINRGQT